MYTIIDTVKELAEETSFIFIVSELSDLSTSFFSAEEIKYLTASYKENDQKLFIFNKLSHVKFVYITGRLRKGPAANEIFRNAGFKLLKHINSLKINEIALAGSDNMEELLLFLAEGMALSNYQFIRYKTGKKNKLNSLSTIYILSTKDLQQKVDELNIIIDATHRCRDMINEPVATMNTVRLAEEIVSLGKKVSVKVEVLNKKKIEALKMGGVLAVNKGSVDPPTFTIMEWKPENYRNKKPLILTGKGVVFDTGGMNIKTGNFMNNMKCDMAGGAAVAAAIYAVAKAGINLHVIGLIPATDNRTNGNAYVNGDIITMYNGSTVEVINTDAEGRMLLADALSYAKKYDPELVINLATLTGSAARAIGQYGIVGMQSGAGRFFQKLLKSGEQVHERIVEFPLWKEYEELIESEVADIKNLGGADAGAITAAKFLEHFTAYPFIHLDIAGPAYVEKTDSYRGTGGTGIGVRLLYDFMKKL